MKKLLVSLMLMTGVAVAQQTAGTLDPSQVYTTGNVVLPTVAGTGQTPWVNGVYQDQLTCWAWGNPGYCGPNAIVRPGNNINFSFGMTDLYQVQAIAGLLPNSGSGLRVNGYNFGFTAKNGNGWDDGRQDYLTAYVAFYGTDGKVKDYTNYDLNSKFNWTSFNYTKDFVSPYATKDLSTVQYGFVGMDNNYWAGPYGPEVYNVSFSLKYSVDPCAVNVLSSPTCPGYIDALAKLAPAPTTTVDPISTTTTSAGTTTTTTIVADPVSATVSTSSTTIVGQPTVVTPVVSAPTSTTAASTSTSTSSSSSSTSTASAQPTKESASASGSNSLALSVISKNQDRDKDALSVAQTAAAAAQQAGQQAQQESLTVAASAVSNSLNMNAVSTNGSQSTGTGIKVNTANSTNFSLPSGITSVANVVNGPQSTNIAMVQQSSTGLGLNVVNNQPTVSVTGPSQSNATTMSSALPLLPPQQMISTNSPSAFTQTEQQAAPAMSQNSDRAASTTETYSIVPPNFLTDKTNPLTEIVEGRQAVPQNNTTTSMGPSVNKNAGDNDVAGGVSINKMAQAPTGYGDYLNFALRDAAFYAPKEVYRNQRTVDNARALRQMTSDSKHREMVEMQYAR